MTQSPMGGMLPDVTQHAEEIEKDRSARTKRHPTPCGKKKPLTVEGPLKTRHLQTVMNVSIRGESELETRNGCADTKEKQFAISRIDTFSQ